MNQLVLLMLLVVLFEIVTAMRVKTIFHPLHVRTFEMPKSCRGQEYCFDNDNYPTDIVEEMMKDITSLVVAADDDASSISTYSDRQGESDLEDECKYLSKKDPIYYIVDEQGRDRVVIQLKGKFEQEFSIMWCDKEGPIKTRTPHFMQNKVSKYEMYCENRYMNYEFLVLSTEPGYNGKWKMERARTKSGIPVCCTCRYDKR